MARHAYDLAFSALREVPNRRMGESQPDYIIRLRAHVANHPSNDAKTVAHHQVTHLAAELLASAERLSDLTPEHEKPKATSVTTGGRSSADQADYMREYMRKRRAAAKLAKEAGQ
jgi:hypothetical protein